MAATRPPDQAPEWLPSGFPPRTFPPGSAPIPPPGPPVVRPARPPGGGRGKWLVAAAVLIALLLLSAVLLLATRGDDGDELATGTSTSSPDTSFPLESTTTIDPTSSSIEPVSTSAAGATTTAVTSPAAAGVLEPSAGALALPRTDAAAGASRAPLTLRNTGAGPLTYASTTSSPGLGASPPRGTIAPGASTTVTVVLDAARLDTEGPFAGTLSFSGTGGAKTVQVTSTVGRRPDIAGAGGPCPQGGGSCSPQIKLEGPGSTPCDTSWRYSVTITDQSRIQSAGVIARRGLANADTPLARVGPTNLYQSDVLRPVTPGIPLRFTTGAVDEHGFARQLAEETITC